MMNPGQSVAAAVADLERSYGGPSQAGFGSAVFHEPLAGEAALPDLALARYRTFVGGLWERCGESAWMGPWRIVYHRADGARRDIVAELRAIPDPDAARSVPMVLDSIDGAEQARATLAAVYDDPAISELIVFNLGDGEAMAGLLIAGRWAAAGMATLLVFLLD